MIKTQIVDALEAVTPERLTQTFKRNMLAVFFSFFFDQSSRLLVSQFEHAHQLPVFVLAVQKGIKLVKELVGVVLVKAIDFGTHLL